MLFTASASARIFMLIPPPRPAMTDMVPARSAIVPTFAVRARFLICDAASTISSMSRSSSAVSLGGGIVLSIMHAERIGQDVPVKRLGGGEDEQPGHGR